MSICREILLNEIEDFKRAADMTSSLSLRLFSWNQDEYVAADVHVVRKQWGC